MKNLLTYLLWPNPGAVTYDNPKFIAIFIVSVGLVLISFTLKMWRKRTQDQMTKKLSKSWPRACLWFGIIGIVLAVSRAEQISYLSMRLWWGVWLLGWIVYAFFQLKIFKMKYYKKLPSEHEEDPRDRYLPRRKRR